MDPAGNTLCKAERLHGSSSVSALFGSGRWGCERHLRFCWKEGNGLGYNRIMVSVPKKFFKRAVKRNLLKRRMREAYRCNKALLPPSGIDLLLSYSSSEVMDSSAVREEVTAVLARVAKNAARG